MNNERREIIKSAVASLQNVLEDEQEALENMPESLQGTEKTEVMESCISALENAINELESIE